MVRHKVLGRLFFFLCCVLSSPVLAAAPSFSFTVTASEPVNVDTTGGVPRIALDVGGVTRYASYASGTGTANLTFTYTATAGDVDLDGVGVSSPLDLNGGSIMDLAGNAVSPLTFTVPSTVGVKVSYPSLSMDFVADADGRYTLNGSVYNDLSSFLTAAGGSFTRASTATYYDSAGNMQTASSGTPRFDYDPVTHVAKGILIEESRVNLISRSEELDNASWPKNAAVTVTANAVADPTSGMTADKAIDSSAFTGTKQNIQRNFTVTPSKTYTLSMYVKAAEYSYAEVQLVDPVDISPNNYPIFNVATGALGSANGATGSGYQDVGNGWKRIWYNYTTDASQTSVRLAFGSRPTNSNGAYNGVVGNGVYYWGIQLEEGSFPTSYIPTTTGTVTRAADFLSVPIGSWYSSSEGTLQGQIYSTGTSASKFFNMTFLDSTNLNRVISISNGSNTAFSVLDTGYTNQASLSKTLTSPTNIAGAYKVNDFAASFDGASPVLDGSGTVPTGFNTFRIGNNQVAGQGAAGNIVKLRYYPSRVLNAQLQLLTQ